MAKFKQECVFGLRAVVEAIEQGKEVERVLFKQGLRKGELFQELFLLVQ